MKTAYASHSCRARRGVLTTSRKIWFRNVWCAFLRSVGLQKDAKAYARLLAENEVDFDGLVLLQDAHLRELGIVKLGIRNKIMHGIAQLKSKRKALGKVLHVSEVGPGHQKDSSCEHDDDNPV